MGLLAALTLGNGYLFDETSLSRRPRETGALPREKDCAIAAPTGAKELAVADLRDTDGRTTGDGYLHELGVALKGQPLSVW